MEYLDTGILEADRLISCIALTAAYSHQLITYKQHLMNRILLLLFTTIGLLTNYSFIPPDDNVERFISVKFESMHQIYNHGVGHEWDNFLFVNKQIIREYEKVTFKLKKPAPLKIEAHAIEKDKHHDDVGLDSITFTYSDLIAIEKNRFEVKIKVMENVGQRAGNLALWRFIFELAKEKE